MILFSLLLALALERLFKTGAHWGLDSLYQYGFRRLSHFSLLNTLIMAFIWLIIYLILFHLVHSLFFGLITLILDIAICWLCIGPGITRQHYRAYLKAAEQGDQQAMNNMSEELALIYGLPHDDQGDVARLQELQNALIWINFRYYLAPLFWFTLLGPAALACYSLFRSYQVWLAHHYGETERQLSGIDTILFYLDWLPVRLSGLIYSFFGQQHHALSAWKKTLTDTTTRQYTVLTNLAQIALSDYPLDDPLKTPIAAVTLAKKTTLFLIIIVSTLTILKLLI